MKMNFKDTIKTFATTDYIAVYNNDGHYDSGKWIDESVLLYQAQVAIQPLTDDEMEMLPEGYRNGKSLKVYIPIEHSVNTDYNILFRGVNYKILSLKKYDYISDYQVLKITEVQS